ncbi:MAG: type III pantothenate kinase [Enterobacterales bacterium]|nr:type III pantothenate kinase [Enterobacterales bacterium]
MIGNTSLKLLWLQDLDDYKPQAFAVKDLHLEHDKLLIHRTDSIFAESKSTKVKDIEALRQVVTRQQGSVKQALISSVNTDTNNQQLQELLNSLDIPTFFAQPSRQTGPLINAYQAPEQLGVDRWLAMIAGLKFSPASAFGVIDLGSAITLDIIDAKAQHLGGHIVPGKAQLTQILAQMGQIRLDNSIKANPEHALGKNTAECVQLGCEQMVKSYLLSSLLEYQEKYQIKQWFITGGGAVDWLKTLLVEGQSVETGQMESFKVVIDQLTHVPDLNFYGLMQLLKLLEQK